VALARRVRDAGGSDVGVAVEMRSRGSDTDVLMGVVTPERDHTESALAFLGGQQGRARAALNTAAFLWRALPPEPDASA